MLFLAHKVALELTLSLISGIQMEQKVHSAFLAASSPFMRERAMNVHM
jgi:hypothetical protein